MQREQNPAQNNADYIIVGAGLSGLSLALSLLDNPLTSAKRMLIIEAALSAYSCRTWCFWGQQASSLEHLVKKTWQNIAIFKKGKTHRAALNTYTYKMINSTDFRTYAMSRLSEAGNVAFIHERVSVVLDQQQYVSVTTDEQVYTAKYVFDSRPDMPGLSTYKGLSLLQQFNGWFVETEEPVFDPETAKLMDFRTPQPGAVAFFYVLPETPHRALIEYTLFTAEAAGSDKLDNALAHYLDEKLAGKKFRVVSTETGIIPMTDYPFVQHTRRVIPIGTAGGCTKPSSGYTFVFAQRQVANIVNQLNAGQTPKMKSTKSDKRFRFYDQVLLRILLRDPLLGSDIFFRLFSKNKADMVLKFLNNETSVWEEMRLFITLPIGLFTKASIRQLWANRN